MRHNTSPTTTKLYFRPVKAGLRVLVLLLMLFPLFNGLTVAQAESDIEWIKRVANHHQLPAHVSVAKNALGLDGSGNIVIHNNK